MVHDDPKLHEQVGLHVLLTAFGLSLLDAEGSPSAMFEHIRIATRWYRDRSCYLSALMSDEPFYNAMRVSGRDARDLDEAGDALWSNYWTISDSVSDLIMSHRSAEWNRLVADIAAAVVSDERFAFDLVLPAGMDVRPSP